MDIINYIILGLLQGFTEPLPISSSGHIFLLKSIFNTTMFDDLNLEIFLNFASFVAILFIFRKDVINLIKGFFKYLKTKRKEEKKYFDYAIKIIIGTIPVGIIGFIVKEPLEKILSDNIFLVGFGFLFTAVSLLLVMNTNGEKKDEDITMKDALIIGLFQTIALVPGISRSGLVLVASLLRGLNKKTAIKYTFMLYLPVSFASMLLGTKDFIKTTFDLTTIIYYLIGMISAGALTYLSYNWLTKLVEKGKLWRFSIYLFAIAIFTIMFFI